LLTDCESMSLSIIFATISLRIIYIIHSYCKTDKNRFRIMP
jgi:hypothetical protein